MTHNIGWKTIVDHVKLDGDEKDYVVDFIDQINSIDGSVYVYYHDDDGSFIYVLNEEHRTELENTIANTNMQLTGPIAEQKAQLAHNVADLFWAELNDKYQIGMN